MQSHLITNPPEEKEPTFTININKILEENGISDDLQRSTKELIALRTLPLTKEAIRLSNFELFDLLMGPETWLLRRQ